MFRREHLVNRVVPGEAAPLTRGMSCAKHRRDPILRMEERLGHEQQAREAMELAELARRLMALDYAEMFELYRLRQCSLNVPTTFASEREELDALRAELQRELAEVRLLTERELPRSFAEPVAELYCRRPLAKVKRKAEEEKAEKKREADQVRFAYLRQKRDLAKRMADAHATLTPAELAEQDALRKNWSEHNMLGDETETDPIYSCPDDCGRKHLSLSAACACANVRNQQAKRTPAAATPSTTTSSTRPSTTSPSPRPTSSPPTAARTSTAWPGSATASTSTTRPSTTAISSTAARSPPRTNTPRATGSVPNHPSPPRPSANQSPTTLAATPALTPARSIPAGPAALHLVSRTAGPRELVPTHSLGTGSRTLGTGSRPVPAAREPVPAPPSGTGSRRVHVHPEVVRPSPSEPNPRRALIREALQSSPTPLSANAIATTVGGRKTAVLEEVRELVKEGELIPVEGGFVVRRC